MYESSRILSNDKTLYLFGSSLGIEFLTKRIVIPISAVSKIDLLFPGSNDLEWAFVAFCFPLLGVSSFLAGLFSTFSLRASSFFSAEISSAFSSFVSSFFSSAFSSSISSFFSSAFSSSISSFVSSFFSSHASSFFSSTVSSFLSAGTSSDTSSFFSAGASSVSFFSNS